MRWLARKFFGGPLRRPLLRAGSRLLYLDRPRRALVRAVDPWLRRTGRHERDMERSPGRIQRERALMARAVFRTVDRMIERRQISPHVMCVITDLWARAWPLSTRQRPNSRRFREANGCDPPWFLVLSPGNECNLNCPGCYADARGAAACLPWSVLDRVMAEAKDLWGVPLFVFYGFYFHYVPIGRRACLDWMPTPAQRVEVWCRTWEAIEMKAYGEELRDLTMPIWDEVYLGSVTSGSREGR